MSIVDFFLVERLQNFDIEFIQFIGINIVVIALMVLLLVCAV